MKKLATALLIWILFFCFVPHVCAAEDADALFAESGAEDAFAVLDEQTLALLEDIGIDPDSPSTLLDITPGKVIASVMGLFTGKLAEPIKKCAVILGVIMLFSVLDTAAPSVGAGNETGGMIFMFMLSFMVIAPVSICISHVLSAIKMTSVLIKLLIPVMAGLIASSGKPLLSAAFSSVSLGAAEMVGTAVDTFFVPLTGAYAAVSVVAAVNPLFNLQNIALFFRKVFTVVLGGVAVIFSGLLSLRGKAAGAADSLVFKGAKFLIGGLVPVVGGALSEGLTVVTGTLEAVNQTVGALGILTIVLILLPSVLEVLIWWAALYFCSLAATLLGRGQIAFYLSGVSNVIVMLNILLLFDGFVFIAALGIVMGMTS